MPTREIYWNITGGALIYVFASVAGACLAFGVYRRVRLWRLGEPASRLDRPWQRLKGVALEVFGHRRALRDPYPGIAHLLIFYGFLAAFIATTLVAVQEWTGIRLLEGTFYLWFSLVSDTFGILAVAGLCMALWRRAVRRPARLHTVLDDWVALGLLLLLFVQGFWIEGLRIAATELRQQPDLAPWSPGGYAVALALQHLEPERLRSMHRIHWWIHAVTAFVFLAYLAYGKLAHIGYGLLNVLLRDLGSSGRLAYPDIEARIESDPEAPLGVHRIEQYTWKGLLDLDACMNCGRCEEVCPAHLSGAALSPRKLIRDLKDHLTAAGPALLAGADPGGARLMGEANGDARVAVLEEELWGCRTCGACQTECPVYVEHIPKMIDMRRHLVMTEAKMSEEVRQLLKQMDERMHPWVGASQDREEWFRDLDVKVLGRGEHADLLLWVGCAGAMVERNVAVTRALAKVLKAGGVDFAVLGAEEVCTGDPARRVGGELTFQVCARRNIETFERYGIRRIVSSCPHCFNTLKNEYPDFGGAYEVTHHAELIGALLKEGRLEPKRSLESVTFHDPCYLGRHGGLYEAPRDVLRGLAGRGELRELPRNRSRSLCCGAGGGYAWMDDAPPRRINRMRVDEVRSSGCRTAAVACPFCMQMFEDALGAADPAGTVRAADLAELVAEALEG